MGMEEKEGRKKGALKERNESWVEVRKKGGVWGQFINIGLFEGTRRRNNLLFSMAIVLFSNYTKYENGGTTMIPHYHPFLNFFFRSTFSQLSWSLLDFRTLTFLSFMYIIQPPPPFYFLSFHG